MLGTRPDLAFAVTQMAKFASNPSDEHLNQAMYILRYLVGTRDYALVFDGNSDFVAENKEIKGLRQWLSEFSYF